MEELIRRILLTVFAMAPFLIYAFMRSRLARRAEEERASGAGAEKKSPAPRPVRQGGQSVRGEESPILHRIVESRDHAALRRQVLEKRASLKRAGLLHQPQNRPRPPQQPAAADTAQQEAAPLQARPRLGRPERSTLRQAVVWSEILGKPRGLQG